MSSPRRARYSSAASASDAHASSAGSGASRPVGRLELRAFFSHGADARAAELDAGLAGADGGECLTTPLGMAGTVLERGVVNAAIEVVRQGRRHCRRSPGAGAIRAALDSVVGKPMAPCTQRRIGNMERVGDGWAALPFDDLPPSLGTAEDTGLLGLFQESVYSGQGIIGKVPCEGPHGEGLQKKLLPKFIATHGSSYQNIAFSPQISQELLEEAAQAQSTRSAQGSPRARRGTARDVTPGRTGKEGEA